MAFRRALFRGVAAGVGVTVLLMALSFFAGDDPDVEFVRVSEPLLANGHRIDPAPPGLTTELSPGDAVRMARGNGGSGEAIAKSSVVQVWLGIYRGIDHTERDLEMLKELDTMSGVTRAANPLLGRPVYIVRAKERLPCEPEAVQAEELLCYRLVAFDADTGEIMPAGGTTTRGVCPVSMPEADCLD